MQLLRNYHTHTKRCGHALGEDEEYVLYAIEAGIKELGFSDHIPFRGHPQPGVRMNYEQIDDYVHSISFLKEKYKNKIKIYIGFECEYFEEYRYYYEELLTKVDYLICGQHFALSKEGFLYVGRKKDDQDVATEYVNRVIAAMKSGLIKYIAHPDIFLNSYTHRDEFIEGEIRRLCKAAETYHIPLEINLEGMKKQVYYFTPLDNRFYPYPYFWNIAKDYDIEVIIGADVHDPIDFMADYDKYAYQMVKDYHLKLIDFINIEDKN